MRSEFCSPDFADLKRDTNTAVHDAKTRTQEMVSKIEATFKSFRAAAKDFEKKTSVRLLQEASAARDGAHEAQRLHNAASALLAKSDLVLLTHPTCVPQFLVDATACMKASVAVSSAPAIDSRVVNGFDDQLSLILHQLVSCLCSCPCSPAFSNPFDLSSGGSTQPSRTAGRVIAVAFTYATL
jgi:hypothetical protein